MREVFANCESLGVTGDIRFTPTLSRGLAYYTGPMWEIYQKDATESKISSTLAAGGRWDGMVQQFLGSKKEYPAVGMTFGLDVIYAVLEERGMKGVAGQMHVPSVLLVPINTLPQTLALATKLREEGISTDITFDRKVGKAFEFANKQEIPFVAVLGEREVQSSTVNLKNMASGEEEQVQVDQLPSKMKSLLKPSA